MRSPLLLCSSSLLLVFGLALPALAVGQPPAQAAPPPEAPQTSGTRQTEGTVTSARRGSMVVRTEDGNFQIFFVTADTTRARRLRPGDRVRVVTDSGDTDAAPTAVAVEILEDGPPAAATEAEAQPLPLDIRRLEAQIERQVQRYRLGIMGGVAFDPELVSIGVFSMLGPVFTPNLTLRPGVELAVGEVTTLIAIHVDALYSIAGRGRQSGWVPYLGAGPNFSFSHRGFESGDGTDRFDFGEFNFDGGVNFIAGARRPSGVFVELKATAYGVANVRVLGGFSF